MFLPLRLLSSWECPVFCGCSNKPLQTQWLKTVHYLDWGSHIAQAGLELLIGCLYLPGTGITDRNMRLCLSTHKLIHWVLLGSSLTWLLGAKIKVSVGAFQRCQGKAIPSPYLLPGSCLCSFAVTSSCLQSSSVWLSYKNSRDYTGYIQTVWVTPT